jgi:ribonuclease P protein component
MLKPVNRLKKVRDFNVLMKYGRWINGQFLDLKTLDLHKIKQELLPKRVVEEWFRKQLKIAFTVGLKIDKRAVVRNRLKRQMREVVRLLIKENKVKEGYYVLFVARAGIKEKEYEEIEQEVVFLLQKARLI